jgi:hypothetical protein
MEDFFKKIQAARDDVYLSEEDKDILDDVVLSFVDAHPLKDVDVQQSKTKSTVRRVTYSQPPFSWVLFGRRLAYGALVAVVFLGGSIGAVLASEKSLPGETLYSVKVNVAEEIRAALIFSPEEKADWEVTRVERRLSEIKTLLEDGDAIEKTIIEEVEHNIESHSNAVAKAALTLQKQGDTEGLITMVDQLQTTLETYSDVLAQIVQEDNGTLDPRVITLFESIEKTQQVAKAAQLDLFLDRADTGDISDEQDTEDVAPNLRVTFPTEGDTLVMGTSYDITWDATIERGSYLSVTLIDIDGNTMGYLGAVEYPATSFEWNPKFILDISGTHQSKDVVAGLYRLRLTVRDTNGSAHQTESELFEIIKPSISAGLIHIDVLDAVGNPMPNVQVEIHKLNKKQLDVEYTGMLGRVDFSLLPGTYTIVASAINSERQEEQVVHIAEVGEQYISVTMRQSRTETQAFDSGPVDLTITDMSVSSDVVKAGETFTVKYDVSNIGNNGIVEKLSHGLGIESPFGINKYYISPDISDSCEYLTYFTNEDVCLITRLLSIDTPGEYQIVATIDNTFSISELREDNNMEKIKVTVLASHE